MRDVNNALDNLRSQNREWVKQPLLNYQEFLKEVTRDPQRLIRNIYQLYADMIDKYIVELGDEYPDDPESIHYVAYDCSELFVKGADRPFFPDRLFANRLVRHVGSLSTGAQQNKVYIFDGPHGSGKSTFLNNLLRKFEEYTALPEGLRYETVWRIPKEQVHGLIHSEERLKQKLAWLLDRETENLADTDKNIISAGSGENQFFEVPCPSHDNPILMVPRESRRLFFDDLFENDKFKWALFTDKEYEWVFTVTPCTICSSIFSALMRKYHDIKKVLGCVYARPYVFKRRLGNGISVYNPGDKPVKQIVLQHQGIQRNLDLVFPDSESVRFLHSFYSRTNNGIYALMDIKSHNTERLMDLHNIISEGVHKVEELEESVNSLFFALMNPEDKKQLKGLQAFKDRIEYIHIPYVLDIKTEVDIYREVFGKHIDESFQPRILHNFARVIIATRLITKSEVMLAWISNPEKYELFCDPNLQLLKMEIYTGNIPKWLQEEDLKEFTAQRRHQIIAESEMDGWKGFSGRDSIRLFNDFFGGYSRGDKLIDMLMLVKFFKKYASRTEISFRPIFLRPCSTCIITVCSRKSRNPFTITTRVRLRSISKIIYSPLISTPGCSVVCTYTKEKLEVSEELFTRIEMRLLADPGKASLFRKDVQKTYTTVTLTQEMLNDGMDIAETTLYKGLHEKYVHHLKEKVLDPFLKNENFRMAVKDFDTENFRTYDKKIQNDVLFMIENLQRNYYYSRRGAKEICMYVIDNDLAKKFESHTS